MHIFPFQETFKWPVSPLFPTANKLFVFRDEDKSLRRVEADHIVSQLKVADGCEERVTEYRQPQWVLWVKNALKLSQLFGGLEQLAGGQSCLMLGYLCGFKEAGPLFSLSGDDLHTRSCDKHSCWHVCDHRSCSHCREKGQVPERNQ